MLASGLFCGQEIARLIDAHESGRADHAQKLWLMLAFEGFLAASEGVLAASVQAA
jgi:hypothetical protein